MNDSSLRTVRRERDAALEELGMLRTLCQAVVLGDMEMSIGENGDPTFTLTDQGKAKVEAMPGVVTPS